MERNYNQEERYIRAKKRVKDIQGFYWHLFWYVVVNLFLTFGGSIRNIMNGDSIELEHFDFGRFSVWFFWGIGLVAHWFQVFGKNIIFSKDWEDRKIKEYTDKDKSHY